MYYQVQTPLITMRWDNATGWFALEVNSSEIGGSRAWSIVRALQSALERSNGLGWEEWGLVERFSTRGGASLVVHWSVVFTSPVGAAVAASVIEKLLHQSVVEVEESPS